MKVKKLNRYYRAEKRRIEIPGHSDVSGSLKCQRRFDPEAALLPAAQAVILGNIIIADHYVVQSHPSVKVCMSPYRTCQF